MRAQENQNSFKELMSFKETHYFVLSETVVRVHHCFIP